MIEDFLPFLLAFASLGAFQLGSLVRRHVHVLIPFKDPVSDAIFLACLLPWLVWGYMNVWYGAFLLTFVLSYSVAYIREEFNVAYVNVHTIISEKFPNGAEEIRPVVYYWDADGNQCYQGQSVKEILKTVLLGVRTPLRLDVGMVRRTRPVYVQKVLFPKVSVEAIDVVEEKITETEEKRWIFTVKVRSVSFTPAPSCIDSTQGWLVSAYNQQNLTRELTRKEAQLLEAKTAAMSNFYARSADLLVEMINDRTPGAEVYRDVTSRLAPEPGEQTIREPEPQPEPQRRKRRGFLRRREKEPEPEPDDEDGGGEE